MEPLGSLPFIELLRVFAERRPVPGCGSGAALAAALGAALGSMAVRYSRGRKGRSEVLLETDRRLDRAETDLARVGELCTKLADRDAEAYRGVLEAWKEGLEPRPRLDEVLKEAIAVPFEVLSLVLDALDSMAAIADQSNTNLIGDLAAGACLLEAAGSCAALAIRSNAVQMADRDHADGAIEEVDRIEESIRAAHKKILDTALTAMSC